MKYRQKPMEVDAIQFTRQNQEECVSFTDGQLKNIMIPRCPNGIMTGTIDTLESMYIATEDDYIVRGVDGNYIPYNPDVFHKAYERVGFSSKEEIVNREMKKFIKNFEQNKDKVTREEYLIGEDYDYVYSYREIDDMHVALYNKIVQYFILNDVNTHSVYSSDRIIVIHNFLKEEFYV